MASRYAERALLPYLEEQCKVHSVQIEAVNTAAMCNTEASGKKQKTWFQCETCGKTFTTQSLLTRLGGSVSVGNNIE